MGEWPCSVGGDAGTETGDARVVKLPCVVDKAGTIVAGEAVRRT